MLFRSSGVSSTSAPWARARLAKSAMREALPARSPRVQLIWAMAIRMRANIALGFIAPRSRPRSGRETPVFQVAPLSDSPITAELEIAGSLAGVPPDQWDTLAGPNPLLSHGFLHALHDSGAACAGTGWTPRYLLLRREGRLAGALPLYLKVHSYGEYVFD